MYKGCYFAEYFNLSAEDVSNIKQAWSKLEQYLLPVGIRVFISILEARSERNPVCKQKACCNNKERLVYNKTIPIKSTYNNKYL